MRGRLIFVFTAEIAQLDTAGTAADPDMTGPLTSGYDPDFREPVRVPDSSARGSHSARKEITVRVPCQVDTKKGDLLQQLAAGAAPARSLTMLFHFADLERLGLVDVATGEAKIRINDRLVAVYDRAGAVLVQAWPDPAGMYATSSEPISFGLSGGRRNLLRVVFAPREQGSR